MGKRHDEQSENNSEANEEGEKEKTDTHEPEEDKHINVVSKKLSETARDSLKLIHKKVETAFQNVLNQIDNSNVKSIIPILNDIGKNKTNKHKINKQTNKHKINMNS